MPNTVISTNTESGNVDIRDSGAPSDSCINSKIMEELTDRLFGSVDLGDTSGLERGVSAPTDITKIWFQEDSTGVVTNIKFYNSLTGQWQDVLSTSKDEFLETLCVEDNAIERLADGCLRVQQSSIPVRSVNSDNLIDLDSAGNWIVDQDVVRDVAAELDVTNTCSVLKKNDTSHSLSVDRGASFLLPIAGPVSALVAGAVIEENPAPPVAGEQTFDLDTIPEATDIDWASCPPSHVSVIGVVAIGVGPGFSGGSWTTPAVEVRAGEDMGRIALAIDSDSTEGTTISEMTVRLTPGTEQTLKYRLENNVGVTDWTDAKNQLAIYVTGFIWTSLAP